MSGKIRPRAIIPQIKDGQGFWLPNDLIDLHASELGARGIYCYCVIARSATPNFYPSVMELSYLLNISKDKVRNLLRKLYFLKLLNDNDIDKIRGFYTETPPPEPDEPLPEEEDADLTSEEEEI